MTGASKKGVLTGDRGARLSLTSAYHHEAVLIWEALSAAYPPCLHRTESPSSENSDECWKAIRTAVYGLCSGSA